MNKMKRLLPVLLCFIIAVCAFACTPDNSPDPVEITTTKTSVELKVGEKLALSEIGATASDGSAIVFSVINTQVAKVEGDELVAVGVGVTALTAKAGSASKNVTVTVTEAPKPEYTVTIGGESQTVTEGTVIARPSAPTKPATAEKEYVFKGWYIVGTDTEYNFVATGNVEVEARFDEVTRKYNVTFDGKNSKKYEYGSLITKPADPEKEATSTNEYEFVGWFNGETAWDFENDTVSGDVNLTAKFNEVARRYNLTVSIVPEAISLKGVPALPLFDFTEADYEGMNPVLTDGEGNEITASAGDGKITARIAPGNYTLKFTYRGKEITESVKMLSGNSSVRVQVAQEVDLGGKMKGEVDGKTYEYPSFGGNYTVKDGTLKTTGISYAYIGEEITDTYYLEADVNFETVGKMVGIMGASEFGNLSNDADKKLQGEDDKLQHKLVFSFSGSKSIFYQHDNGWGGAGVTSLLANISDTVAVANNHKLAVLRKANDYYIFLNDILFAHYETDFYGKAGFGFCNANGGTATYSNITYTVRPDVVNAILNAYDTSTFLGGSFTYPNGTTYKSFAGNWTLTSHNSGTIKGPSYIYANDKVGNIYYLESTFSNTENWIGLLVNTLDLEPQKNKGWLAYGHGYGQIFHHNKTGNWNVGDSLGSFSIGSGEWKMGVARVNSVYYVFINDKLCLEHSYDAFKTSNHGELLPKDNASGMGIFCGNNFGNTSTFKDFYATTDETEVFAKIASYAGADLTYTDDVSVEQYGKAVASGARLIAGLKTVIDVKVPAGKKIGSLVVKKDGVQMGVEYEDDKFVFYPSNGSTYDISATFVDDAKQKATINLIPVTNKVGDKSYALYDMTVNPSEVSISVFDFNKGTETVMPAPALKIETEYATGYYMVSVTYKSNVYQYFVTVEKGKDAELTCFLSPAYLGGTITIPNENGVETTYKTFQNVEPTATKGGGWTLVDGRRDTVTVSNHSYVFQHQQAGTKYYVEGKFNANQTYNFFGGVGGLLISHGPKNLEASSDKKLIAGIYGDSVILVVAPGWNAADSRLIANYVEIIGEVDPTSVKLGVVRDGTNYWFFVNDKYVGFYNYEDITTKSGFGVACVPVTVTISNFNYSFNNDYIEALKASGPKQTEKEIDIYIIAGQSNASGYTAAKEADARKYDERLIYGTNNVWYAGDAESTSGSTTAHRKLGWGLARLGQGASASKLGPEAGMMLSLADYYNAESGKIAGMIKFAHGGTALLDSITGENAAGGNWVPPSYEATISPKSPGNLTGGLYRTLLSQTTQNVNELKAMGFTKINIKGMFWMQGESDKGNPTEYKKAFKYFASDIRRDLGKITGEDLSKMPIIVGEISRTSGSDAAGTVNTNNAFIAMQNTLATEVNDVYVVASGQFDIAAKVNGTVVGTDAWHWNQADMLSIGEMVGDCIVNKILKK